MATTPEDEFLRSHRLELALAYLQRADQSADRIRAMTLAIATAAFGFIIHQYNGNLVPHFTGLVVFSLAIALTFISWNMQKAKAIKRFDALKDDDLCKYRCQRLLRNHRMDWAASFFVVVGFGSELLTRVHIQIGP